MADRGKQRARRNAALFGFSSRKATPDAPAPTAAERHLARTLDALRGARQD